MLHGSVLQIKMVQEKTVLEHEQHSKGSVQLEQVKIYKWMELWRNRILCNRSIRQILFQKFHANEYNLIVVAILVVNRNVVYKLSLVITVIKTISNTQFLLF